MRYLTPASRFLTALLLFGSVIACGGGGSDETNNVNSNTNNTDNSTNQTVETLLPSHVAFEQHLDLNENISLPVPSHWESQYTDNEQTIIAAFTESIEHSDDAYRENVKIIKVPTGQTLTDELSDIEEISSSDFAVAGLNGRETIFTANLAEFEQLDFQFMQIVFELRGYTYAILYSAEKAVFQRNVELVRHIASHFDVGQTVFDNYSLNSDLSHPGKPALASDGEKYLVVTCKKMEGAYNDYELMGRIINADRSMEESFSIHPNVDTGNTGCRLTNYSAIYNGNHYLLVYMTNATGYRQIVAKRISTTGIVMDTLPITISLPTDRTAFEPNIVFDGQRTLVVWHESTDDDQSIQGAFITGDGTVASRFTVVQNLQDTYRSPNIYAYTPKAALGDNQFMVIWQPFFFRDTLQEFPQPVYGQLLDLSGNTLLAQPLLIRDDNGDNPRYADLASDGNSYLVGWIEGRLATNTIGDGKFTIYARQISSAGEILRGADPAAGIEVAPPMFIGNPNDEEQYPKDFLDVSYHSDAYVFLWSSTRNVEGSAVYRVDVSQNLNVVSDPVFIPVPTADGGTTTRSAARQPAIVYSQNHTVIAWVSDTLDAWFFAH